MCGITGFTGSDPDLLRRMTERLVHRGPDDMGYYEDAHVSLGMRRLSIIDVEGGHQPLTNEAKSIWTVFNGEIYNFVELRKELKSKGHTFSTNSDTEVIVHLYEEWGDDFVNHLNGMFAVAIWDAPRQRLLLARDRLGIKPVYYVSRGGRIWFASEIKSLLCVPTVTRDIDAESLLQYLSLQYIPADRTIFDDINSLRPGHLLVFERREFHIGQYWDLQHRTCVVNSEGEAAEAVLEKLRAAVRSRMVSDVPVGAFLSGGLDSSAIVALMSESSSKVATFSMGFGAEDSGFSELAHARKVAEAFGTDHHECVADFRIADLLPQVLWHFDQPFGNSTSVLVYLLSEFTSKHVKVALSGTGGDEVFMGYPRYLGLSLGRLYRRLPQAARRALSSGIKRLPEFTSGNTPMMRLTKRMRRFAQGCELSEEEAYLTWVTYFNARERRRLVPGVDGDGVDALLMGYLDAGAGQGIQDRASYLDLKSYLPGNQLEYMDKMSMAWSLEARVPFCDHGLLEYSASLPHEHKIRGWETKRVLKRACKELVPHSVLSRRKVGFDAPAGAWLQGGLRSVCEGLFSEKSLAQTGFIDHGEVRKLMDLHQRGKRDLSQQIWSILVFEIWYRMYVMADLSDRPNFSLTELLNDQGISVRAA